MTPTFRRRPRTDIWFCDRTGPLGATRFTLNPSACTLLVQQTNEREQRYGLGGPAREHGRVLPPLPADAIDTTPVAFAQAYNRFVKFAGAQAGTNAELVLEKLRTMRLPATGLEFLLLTTTPEDPLAQRVPAPELAELIRTTPPELPGPPQRLSECSTDAEHRQFCRAAHQALDDKLYDWLHEHGYRARVPQVAIVDEHTHQALQASFARYANPSMQPPGRVVRYTSQFGSVELLVDPHAPGPRLDIFG